MVDKVVKSISKLELYKIIRNLEAELEKVTAERDEMLRSLMENRNYQDQPVTREPIGYRPYYFAAAASAAVPEPSFEPLPNPGYANRM
jgi:hypothetical protein